MNRFVFGRGWVFCDETNGTDANGTAGGAAAVDDAAAGDGDGDGGGEGERVDADSEGGGAAVAPGAKKEEAPKDMKSAIDLALGYKKGPDGEALDPLTGKVKEPPAKPGEKKPDAGVVEKHANGAPKKGAKGEDLDDKGQVVQKQAPKLKTAAELDLTPDEKKALHAKTQARFGDVITTLKAHEGTIAKQTETIKGLAEARDAIVSVLQETKTTNEQFVQLVTFNGLLQSGDPKNLEQALTMVEDQRTAIYKALGREPAGGDIDLLADFPDLKTEVEEARITRAAALEIAQGRRDRSAREQAAQGRQQQQRQQTQTQDQWKKDGEAAEADISKWVAELVKGDLDYKAKEDKLMSDIDSVLKEYPPKMWLPTLKLLYKGIEIQKAPVTTGGHRPLRPSGAKPGAKAPNDMLDAINQGLGYATPAKG